MTRRLYLVRHGDALPGADDFARPLSSKGSEDIGRLARFLKSLNIEAAEIWHSPRIRAVQTARLISEVLSFEKIIEKTGISPDDSPEAAADIIEEYFLLQRKEKAVFIVSHMPLIPALGNLLAGSSFPQAVPCGACACLEGKDGGRWILKNLWT